MENEHNVMDLWYDIEESLPLNDTKLTETNKPSSFIDLFHFADKTDKIIMIIACCLSTT